MGMRLLFVAGHVYYQIMITMMMMMMSFCHDFLWMTKKRKKNRKIDRLSCWLLKINCTGTLRMSWVRIQKLIPCKYYYHSLISLLHTALFGCARAWRLSKQIGVAVCCCWLVLCSIDRAFIFYRNDNNNTNSIRYNKIVGFLYIFWFEIIIIYWMEYETVSNKF